MNAAYFSAVISQSESRRVRLAKVVSVFSKLTPENSAK